MVRKMISFYVPNTCSYFSLCLSNIFTCQYKRRGHMCCNSLNFRSFSQDLRNEIDQCTVVRSHPRPVHSRDANLRGRAITGLSSHDQRTQPGFDLRSYGLTRECFEPTETGLLD